MRTDPSGRGQCESIPGVPGHRPGSQGRGDRPGPPRHVLPSDEGDHQAGDDPRLSEDEHARHDPGRQDAGDLGPGCGQMPAQARVRRPHRVGVGMAGVAGAAAVEAGMWCTAIRLRNTQ